MSQSNKNTPSKNQSKTNKWYEPKGWFYRKRKQNKDELDRYEEDLLYETYPYDWE